MYKFSKRSLGNLSTAHPLLKEVCEIALAEGIIDFVVIEGHRDKATQDRYFAEGASKLRWPKSKHNRFPSEAVDIVPYPVDFKDIKRFQELAVVIKAAWEKIPDEKKDGWKLYNGADWKNFIDRPHWEIKKDAKN
jgi:peptidoglycan L-alanyl-D-glutamate endopeptidase CwlK